MIALFNAHDRWHIPVLEWLRGNPRATLLSTWPVATEVCALLARRIGNDCALDFLRWVQRGAVALQPPADGSVTDADFDVYRDRAGRPLVNLLRG
jgi:predicted nucleic acid-binding protein